jgi:hypothetical protein
LLKQDDSSQSQSEIKEKDWRCRLQGYHDSIVYLFPHLTLFMSFFEAFECSLVFFLAQYFRKERSRLGGNYHRLRIQQIQKLNLKVTTKFA